MLQPNQFYDELPFIQRCSVHRSMKKLSQEFLQAHHYDFSLFNDNDEVLMTLYFYWLRRSAEEGYYWSKSGNSDMFSERFAEEMSRRLGFVFHKLYLKGSVQQYHHFLKKGTIHTKKHA